jgi:hypothetical protein
MNICYQYPPMQQQEPKLDYKTFGTKFCEYYYGIMEQNLAQLPSLFFSDSMITYEGSEYLGVSNLLNVLNTKRFKHKPDSIDVQPVDADKYFIHIMGKIESNAELAGKKYSEFLFVIKNPQDGRYYIKNCMFRSASSWF